jgi:MraZ protein
MRRGVVRAWIGLGRGIGWRVFRSTFEKQLDSKRRIVLPQEFRAAAAEGPAGAVLGDGSDGVFCFPSIEADCLEGGGPALFQKYLGVIEELPFGDPLRSALEFSVIGGMRQLPFDTAGRIVLPESFCEQFGLNDWVAVVGLGDRFQIWSQEAYRARRDSERLAAQQGLSAYRMMQRGQKPQGQTAGGAA